MKINKETKELAISKGYLLELYNQSELQEWLRNEKNLHIDIYLGSKSFLWEINIYIIDLKKQKKIKHSLKSKLYDTYEDALEICLQEMLKIL